MRAPQPYCPVCSLWERVCKQVRPGERLFPSWASRMFTKRLRNLASRLGHEGAGRLGTHSVRRGAALAISEPGGTFAQTLRAGRWRSPAHRLFLDPGADEPAATPSILIEVSGAEGDEREGPQGGPIP